MAGAIRGRAESIKYRLSCGVILKPLVLSYSGKGLLWYATLLCSVALLCSGNPSTPRLFLEASSLSLDAHLNSPSTEEVVEQSCVHIVVAIFVMPHLRHRMRSCRGTPRRAPSCPSSNSPSVSSDLSTGHYPHTQWERAPLSPQPLPSWLLFVSFFWLSDFHLQLFPESAKNHCSCLGVLS